MMENKSNSRNTVESFVFHKSDFESLLELNTEDRKEVLYDILMKVFEDKEFSAKPQNKIISKVLSDKMIRSAKKYFKIRDNFRFNR